MVMTPAASDAATVFHFTAGLSTWRVMLDCFGRALTCTCIRLGDDRPECIAGQAPRSDVSYLLSLESLAGPNEAVHEKRTKTRCSLPSRWRTNPFKHPSD